MDLIERRQKDIPCLQQPAGCVLCDHDSEKLCADQCILIRMWMFGYDAGVDACPPTTGSK